MVPSFGLLLLLGLGGVIVLVAAVMVVRAITRAITHDQMPPAG